MDISEYKFNTEWVIAYVKLRLRDHFLQEWNSNLEMAWISDVICRGLVCVQF